MGSLVRQVVFAEADDVQAVGRLHTGPDSGVVCDPGPVGLWRLEAMLTGRDHRSVMRSAPDPVAVFEQGQRVVLPLGDQARDALARQSGVRGLIAASRWSRTDEVRLERLTGAATGALLRELTSLARSAQAEQKHLYLWIDVDPTVPA
ncbi:hypothetical protein ACFWEJ_02100 [Promicromonospora sp. NPDC060204]|uniref:hypothetical protein n=1 Tax=Promicromonospora sp. NPDC060204 TaxID=3347071 RepID=UPI00364CACE0